MTTISMKHPQFPEDYTFGIPGIGVLKNDGTPLEVDDDQVAAFEEQYGASLADYYNAEMFTVNTQKGQTQPQIQSTTATTTTTTTTEQPETPSTPNMPGE